MSSSSDGGKASGKTGATGDRPADGLRTWLVPVLGGLALGVFLALVVIPAVRRALRGEVWAVVDRWSYDDYDANEELRSELRAMGASAREELVEAYLAVPGEEPEWKLWVADVLGRDPFFDTDTLKKLATEGKPWDTRIAAVALVEILGTDGLPPEVRELVMPVLFAWIEDLNIIDHQMAVRAIMTVEAEPGDEEQRFKTALLALIDARSRPLTGDADIDAYLPDDRHLAVDAAGSMLPDRQVLDVLRAVAEDEKDDIDVRVMAIRRLAEGRMFDDMSRWRTLGASAEPIVRQTVADNSYRCDAPEMDEVLAPLHLDPTPFVRGGSVDAQTKRRRPTALPLLGQLMLDHEQYVQLVAIEAVPMFKDLEQAGLRNGMLLHQVEHSDDPVLVEAAVVALYDITAMHPGFPPQSVRPVSREVDGRALDAFMADAGGRKAAVQEWQAHFGGTAVWTEGDRRKDLEALLDHADPDNQAKARAELGER